MPMNAHIAVIEYERAGTVHRTKLVSNDPMFLLDLRTASAQKNLNDLYARQGSTILRMVAIEDAEHEMFGALSE